MRKNYVNYAQSGIGNTYSSKAEKTDIIRNAIESVITEKNKYVIGGIGGFAGCFDFGAYIQDKILKEYTREIIKKYNLKKHNYEKRLPYVLAAEWLERRLNFLQKLRTR